MLRLMLWPEHGGNMHIVEYCVPLYGVTRAVGAEYGIRRVVRVAFRVVAYCGNDLVAVVAGEILGALAGKPAPALCVAGKYGGVALQLYDRRGAGYHGVLLTLLRRGEAGTHGLQVVHGPAYAFLRYLQTEAVPWLQQLAFSLH